MGNSVFDQVAFGVMDSDKSFCALLLRPSGLGNHRPIQIEFDVTLFLDVRVFWVKN